MQESENTFRPADHVATEQLYQYTIYQEYACLTTEEFERVFKIAPSQALPKVKPIAVPWHGPETSGKKLTHFWLVGLEGIPSDVLPWIRKARIEFSDRVAADQFFLRPEDQLVDGQGKRVFGWLATSHDSKRPAGLTMSGPSPISFKDIQGRMARSEQLQNEAVFKAAAKAEADGSTADGEDDFDNLLCDMDPEHHYVMFHLISQSLFQY